MNQATSKEEITSRVQQVIAEYAEIGTASNTINADDDLFALGMSSRASVGVMLGLESEFDIEFPDNMLRKDVFESIGAITLAIQTIQG